jgi:gluconate 5-dehydrogenase
MIPDGVPDEVRAALLPAEVMAAPVVWLCSPAAEGVTDERVVATEFDAWRRQREQRGQQRDSAG